MMNLVFESINPIEIPQWMINWAHNQQKFSVFVFYTVELYWIESDSESFPCGITKQWGNGTDSMSSNNKSLMCRRAFFDQQWNSKLVSAQYLLQIAIPHMSVCFSACDWQPLNKKKLPPNSNIPFNIVYKPHSEYQYQNVEISEIRYVCCIPMAYYFLILIEILSVLSELLMFDIGRHGHWKGNK